MPSHPPVLGFVAWSGTGKTTLLTRLIPILCERGLRIAVIKSTHHDIEPDTPGKDSYRLREAGAAQTLIASRKRFALITEIAEPGDEPPPLAELLDRLDADAADLVIVEGMKHERFPKIELHRPELGRPLIHPGSADFVALATDAPEAVQTALPVLPLNDPGAIADFVVRFVESQRDERDAETLP